MKDKGTAALLAFFLGFVGIHKFYLGENLAGILYAVFSWTCIPGIIAFFEFLGLLLMSDQAFNSQSTILG
ncbi:MAG: NINE protein [Potamolinea sp.]